MTFVEVSVLHQFELYENTEVGVADRETVTDDFNISMLLLNTAPLSSDRHPCNESFNLIDNF